MVINYDSPFLCPACGYDIDPPNNVDVLTCPECGDQATRDEVSSRRQHQTVMEFYRVSTTWIIGPTLIPGVVLLIDLLTAFDLSSAFVIAWVLCVPLALLGFSTAVILAYRKCPWVYRRRMQARWIALMILPGILLGAAWLVLDEIMR